MARVISNKERGSSHQNLLLNDGITAKEVRLVGADGQPVGVVPIKEALSIAYASGLDLVMISEDSIPPVCKILDYGKYKYEQQRKKVEAKKKQKIVDLKEVQLRLSIGENDLLIKCKSIKKFVENGDKVKLILRFRGRELNCKEFGHETVQKVLNYCQEFAKEESPTKMEGSVLITILTKR